MISVTILAAVLVGGASQVMAYNASCGDNLAVYWGQNSVGGQQNLAAYCQDSTINAIPIAFLNKFFSTGGLPEINLANTCGIANGVFPGTSLANCQFLAADIEACQQRNKIVTLSLGGGTGIDALASDTQGIAFANTIWDLFLGGSSDTRPFGSAVLDGVDLDIEAGSPTGFAAFVNQIRNLSVGANKQYFVTAAPQCPFPDAHLGDALNAANFDAIYVQFYNNACGISTPDTFDFWAWDTWAKTVSPNKNVKIFIGAPASPAAADGYIDAETLGALAVSTRSQFSSFGGVMLWDAAAAFANDRYDQQIKSLIDNNCAPSTASSDPVCSEIYTVVSGDTCGAIETKTGVSDAQLHSLNPFINNDCSNLVIGLPLCVSPGSTSPPSGCTQMYTVVSGDTCGAIESKTGISDATLHSLNPTINNACSNLQIGQTLCVGGGSNPPPSDCSETYTVVSNDTCAVIESKTGTSDATLHSLNPTINSDCTNLQIGQTLCVSGGCALIYTVVSGDTCAIVESKTGISDAALHLLNPSINSACSNLQVGQNLCVSGGSSGSCTQTYTVASGDTCFAIESRFGISDTTLHSLNPSIDSACSNLQVGQTLCVE